MQTTNRDLFINILQSIEHDLEVESGMSKDAIVNNRKQKQVSIKQYAQYRKESHQLQAEFINTKTLG